MGEDEHVRANRTAWGRLAEEYQANHAPQIREQAFTGDISWGLWGLPESRLNLLGDVTGQDVLEFGCGGAQWSTALVSTYRNAEELALSRRWPSESVWRLRKP